MALLSEMRELSARLKAVQSEALRVAISDMLKTTQQQVAERQQRRQQDNRLDMVASTG